MTDTRKTEEAPAKVGAQKGAQTEGYRDLSEEEALQERIPLASIVASLSKDQSAALCRGETVVTKSGTLFPLVAKLPGAEEPMVTAILSRVTQDHLDDWRANHGRFEANMAELLKATASAAPEAMPAIKELLESYRAYDDSTSNVVDTLLSDFHNMLASFGAVPALTIRAQKGSAATKRHEKSPAGRAKAEAIKLWPDANRNGWTAADMHRELELRGQTASYGTVAKWMTKLRKTGTC